MNKAAEDLMRGDVFRVTVDSYTPDEATETYEVRSVERDGDSVHIVSKCLTSTGPAERVGRTVTETASYWDRYELV